MLAFALLLISAQPPAPFAEAEAIVAAFRAAHHASEGLELDPLQRELIDPALVLPRTQAFDRASLATLSRWARSCREESLADPRLAKAAELQRALCSGSALSADFFTRPPFMHPLGGSFAARANGPVEMLHALERPETLLGRLGPDALAALVARAPIVLGQRDVLLREPGLVTNAYAAYPRAAWDAHLASQPLVLADATAECVLPSGPYCWQRRNQSRALVLVTALAVTAALALAAVMVVARWRSRRRAAAERRFMLHTLTHELRTPATALTLALEPLRADFDRLSDGGQSAFLQLCDEVQRLHRMVDRSRRYLQADAKVEVRRIESVNALLDDVLVAVRDRVELMPLAQDTAVRTDPHWFAVCMRNLVDNALEHGRPPVQVSAAHDGGRLEIVVRDSGRLPVGFRVRPLAKGLQSHGMGLGLSIAQHLAERLGGKLTWSVSPTAFRLDLPGAT